MKKKVLTALAAVFMSAVAIASATPSRQKVPVRLPGVPMDAEAIYNPQGEETAYIMNVSEYGAIFGEEEQEGYKMAVRRSADGTTIWFRDLNPGFNRYSDDEEYTWIKGTINGNDITVRAGQVVYANEDYGQKLYFEAVTLDESSSVDTFLDEVHFTIVGDRIVQADDNVYIAVYEDGETMDDAGIYMFFFRYDMQPVGEIEKIVPPADAETQQWLLTSNAMPRPVSVARSGDEIYIAGLSEMAPEDYVKGTVKDGVLTIKSGYILTSNERYYIRLIGATEGETDDWGVTSFNVATEYTFEANENRLTMTPADMYIIEASYGFTNFYSGIQNVDIFPYAGDKPAVPAAPEVEYDELNEVLSIVVPSADTDGNYINPANLSYRVLFDGQPYEFSTTDYLGLYENMTEIPYGFTDYWDFYANGPQHTIFLHNAPEWTTVTVESTYTVDGVSNTSAGKWSGITSVTGDNPTPESVTMTDILGRTVTNPSPGSVVIVRSTYSDGSVRTEKRIVK